MAHDLLPFALVGRWAGRSTIVGGAPLRVADPQADPFSLLDDVPVLDRRDEAAALGAVGGGWFGWLGYGLGAKIERLPPQPHRPVKLPDYQLAYYDHVLHKDRRGRWWFEALVSDGRRAFLHDRLAQLRRRLADAPAMPAKPHVGELAVVGGAARHVAAVADARERIAAGEIFQANICARFETAWDGDLMELFAHAAGRTGPRYGAVFPTPWGGVASLSPELFLRRRGRTVITDPIRAPLSATPAAKRPRTPSARCVRPRRTTPRTS